MVNVGKLKNKIGNYLNTTTIAAEYSNGNHVV